MTESSSHNRTSSAKDARAPSGLCVQTTTVRDYISRSISPLPPFRSTLSLPSPHSHPFALQCLHPGMTCVTVAALRHLSLVEAVSGLTVGSPPPRMAEQSPTTLPRCVSDSSQFSSNIILCRWEGAGGKKTRNTQTEFRLCFYDHGAKDRRVIQKTRHFLYSFVTQAVFFIVEFL